MLSTTARYPRIRAFLVGIALGAGLAACSTSEPGPRYVPPPCDDTRRPVVFVHGFLGSGDQFFLQEMRFAANGYCPRTIRGFDWPSTDGVDPAQVADLDDFIDGVLADTGFAQVDLAGHSAGGRLGLDYLADAGRAAKIAHYAHLASFSAPNAPAGVAMLQVYSTADTVVADATAIPGATNVERDDADHMQAATDATTFDHVFRFFNDGEAPVTTAVEPEGEVIQLGGRVVTLGENAPLAGGRVEVWEVDPATAERRGGEPQGTFTVADDGRWGPFVGYADRHYEFAVTGAERPVHYYREPFARSSSLVYLRVFPPASSLAGLFLAGVRYGDDRALLVTFTAHQTTLLGRDSLEIDGLDLNRPELTGADQSAIAMFVYDGDNDGQTDDTPIAIFSGFPFLGGVDHFIAADPPRAVPITFNGRTLRVRNWPSETSGVSIAVFN